jgi:iron complex outermembrane recepter protein
MKKIPLFILLVISAINANAQFKVTGVLLSGTSKTAIAGASIQINQDKIIQSDESGLFIFPGLTSGLQTLKVSSISHKMEILNLNITSDTVLKLLLLPESLIKEEIIVTATRADSRTPFSSTLMDKKEIQSQNFGQDMPFILNQLPSVVATSDAGTGIGYTGLRIRGTDPSRINVTVNGIPMNDAESHNLYWVDLPDLASSVENIQVQRGVGTSTNGAGSFGGSVNIQTLHASETPYSEINFSAGSFNTIKSNLVFGSGRINKAWSIDGRLSKITSDGFVDRAASDLKSFFVSTGYTGKKTIIRLQIFSGKEITYQSWNGVPEALLKNDKQGILDYISRNFTTSEEADNLLNSDRSYNYYTYKNQVDDYQQDHYQLHFSHAFNSRLKANASLHYTYGRGFFEEFKYANGNDQQGLLSFYGLDDITIGNDTISATDLVRRKWLKNDFYGLTFSINYNDGKKHQVILGGAANEYDGLHFHEINWMQYAVNIQPGQQYYDDRAVKTDANIFLKYSYLINDKISLYTDQQIRNVNYTFNAVPDINSTLINQQEKLFFYNPKAGIYITPGEHIASYFSIGIANKEPNRADFTQSTINSRPKAENLTDYEAGLNYRNKYLNAGINFYFMDYNDQLVLTGALNDVGNYTRTNTPKSSRTGMELTASFYPLKKLEGGFALTLSKNKIESFTEFITDYDKNSEIQYEYKNTDIAFSPEVIGSANLKWKFTDQLSIQLNGKYVGKQFLDNTSSDSRSIDAYQVYDAILCWKIHLPFVNEITASVLLNNILDTKYVSNGYTYGYFYGSLVRENMYYPQAGFNMMGQVSVRF